MEEKIREIVAVFIKVPAEQIGPGTPIGRPALQSSILLHRMYAKLAEAGLVIDNYNNINVFADLWTGQPAGTPKNDHLPAFQPSPASSAVPVAGESTGTRGVGIDIEEVSAMPEAADFRSVEFYRMNFAPAEIAYCILQADPYSSFTGLFAAKEALVKADALLKGRLFNNIVIDHTPEGKPLYPGFSLSISHAGGLAVAVAVHEWAAGNGQWVQGGHQPAAAGGQPAPPSTSNRTSGWIAWLALLLSVLALVRVLTR
jgi:phosphopantetheinyl transferase (holo-ACP synthase)